MTKLKRLRFGSEEQQADNSGKAPRKDGMAHFLTVEQRRTPEWETAVRDYLNELDSWKKDHGEPEAAYFHQVCLAYGGLLTLMPPGPLQTSVLQTYFSFLAQSPMQRESPPEWLLHVTRLMSLDGSGPGRTARMREELKRTGHPVMTLYAELERIAPTK